MSDPTLPSFIALSYAWGDRSDIVPLSVSDRTLSVTKELNTILQCLSTTNSHRLFWIDAICINQEDLNERAAQVALMCDIYSRATYVLAFLSPRSDTVDLGLDYLEQAAANPHLHYEPSLSPHITVDGLSVLSEIVRDSLIAFFAAPWWTRVWTVQEFVLAKKVIFQCGNRLIDADMAMRAFSNLKDHERNCCWSARRATDGYALGFLDYPSGAHNGLSVYKATLRMDNLLIIMNPNNHGINGLLDVMGLFRTRKCSDPRDRVYGMLGLRINNQDSKHLIQPDYRITTALLYQELSMAMIEKSQTLDVLSHATQRSSIQGKTPGLPSWVPDWDATVDDAYHLVYQSRLELMRLYKASGDTKPIWELDSLGYIATQALPIGVVATTSPGYPVSPSSAPEGAFVETWRQLAGLPSNNTVQSDLDQQETAARELAFQVMICGDLAPSDWMTSNDRTMYTKAYKTWHTWFTHPNPANLSPETRELAREFDILLQVASLGRCFFVTEDGTWGFGPEGTQPGDSVVIMPGGKVPYVLKRSKLVSANGGDVWAYEFLGDAFMRGVMLAELFSPETPEMEEIILL